MSAKKFASDFTEFVQKGNALDMAVGVITGAALTGLVNSLVADVITPPIGLLAGGLDFSKIHIPLGHSAQINLGAFINVAISFLITMFAIFLIVRAANNIRDGVKSIRHKGDGCGETSACPYCLMQVSIKATRCPFCTSHLPADFPECKIKK